MSATTLTEPSQLVKAIGDQWRRGAYPDALGVLARHPELLEDESAVIDLIYEELWARRHRGETINPEDFLAKFSRYRSLLQGLLLSDQLIGDHPSRCDRFEANGLPWPAAGERFGDFTLIRELGRGSFGRVYLATEATEGGRPVAVKLSWKNTPEACTLGRLDHGHIVPILWAGYDEPTRLHVVCMPYLGSTTLRDVFKHAYPCGSAAPPAHGAVIAQAIRNSVRAGDPSPDRCPSGPNLARLSYVDAVLRLAEHLADALTFLRQRRLAHGDLKPANVLLTPSGRPLLLDFNLSQANNVPVELIGGTFQYMAPEHITAWLHSMPISTEEGVQADLYSLGVILYELLTGHHPLGKKIDSLTGADVARGVLEQQKLPIQPVRELNPSVPSRIARLLHRCLSPDPSARPAGPAALAAELRRHRRRFLGPIVAGACTLLLAAVAVFAPLAAVKLAPVHEPAFHRNLAKAHLIRGWQLVQDGRSDEAAEPLREGDKDFAQAIDAHVRKTGTAHGEWEDYAGRGRAKMLLGQYGEAKSLFLDADGILRNLPAEQKPAVARLASLWACLSFCCVHKRDHASAVFFGDKAIKSGFRAAVVFNNVGYSYLQQRKYDEAEQHLGEALRLDPDFLPAMRNEVQLTLDRCRGRLDKGEKVTVPQRLLYQLDHVIPQRIERGCSEPHILYFNAANLCSRLGDVKRAREYLVQACRLGADLAELKRNRIFKKHKKLAEWLDSAEAANLRRPTAASTPDSCLMDPLAAALP